MRRRSTLVVVGALAFAGCGAAPHVEVRPVGPPPSVFPLPSSPATTAAAVTLPAPASSVPTVPVPVIATHDARLDALPAAPSVVPVAITTGDTAVAGPVVPTGVDPATGELAVPPDAHVVAWYQYGPTPGDGGSAVLAGHVDWHGALGVFFRLRSLHTGDAVDVTMSDTSVRHFHVTDVQLIAKPEVPFADLFTRVGPPTLTLVTCGGSFDASTRHYRSNVIVTAVPG